MKKKAIFNGLWAPILTPTRGTPWVLWTDMASTRRAAIGNWIKGMGDPEKARLNMKAQIASGYLRFAKVTITEQP